MKRSYGEGIENHSIKKYFKKASENEVILTRMSTNDVDSSNDSLSLATNTQSIVFQNISNKDETIVESSTPMIENRDLVRSGEQTNESTAEISSTSSLEMIPSTTTTNVVNNNQYSFDVDQIGVKLRLIEQLIGSCQDLIKQSTSIDLCIETFAKNSNGFADALIQAGTELNCLCTNIVSTIESNRNKITITEREEDKMVNRDPGKLDTHFSSVTHRSSVERYLNYKTKNVNIDLMLDSSRRKANQEQESILQLNKQVIVTLLDSARYLVKQGLAFRREPESQGRNREPKAVRFNVFYTFFAVGNFIQLINLLRRSNITLNDWFSQAKLQKYQVSYMSKRSQDEYIQLLGAAIEHQIVNEINHSPFISILIDSTPDLSHREMYSIVIRYTYNYQVKERLLSLQELASKVGEDICQLLLDTLGRKGISTDKIVGQCYDNSPNMSGVNKGVQACINKKLNRQIMHIPCEAHSSNLAVEHACDCSTEFVNLFMFLEELYNFFTSSVKRYYVLRDALEKSTFGLTVKSLSETRWNANYESLHCVVESHHEILDCLESIESIESKEFDKETKAQAKNIRNKLMSYEFVVLLKFMVHVTRTTNSLTIHLQTKELDILSSLELMTNTNKLIQKMRNDDEALKSILLIAEKLVEPFNIDIDQEFNRLHRLRQRSRRIDENPLTAVQLTREAFYVKLFRQILDHLYVAYNDYLQVMTEKLRYFHNLTPNRIQQLTINDCKQMYKIVPGLSSEDLLFTEFELLRDSIEQCENMENVVGLLQKSGHLYPRVAKVYNFLFTLPITTATKERCFSKLKLIKNHLRTTLKNERIEYLILCSTENDLLDDLDLTKLADEWVRYFLSLFAYNAIERNTFELIFTFASFSTVLGTNERSKSQNWSNAK
ncbi:unnamed protein product [Rotaria sp. Silwood2]|nr:unnamed protein product [Rotaria sp. Silwood2]CAF3357169.1 unnamed protein product [Rotaria sp. Silwood2]